MKIWMGSALDGFPVSSGSPSTLKREKLGIVAQGCGLRKTEDASLQSAGPCAESRPWSYIKRLAHVCTF